MSRVRDLFDIWAGHGIDLIRLEVTTPDDPDGVAYISRAEKHNGILAYVKVPAGVSPAAAGTLSVAVGGSICSTFVQPRDYICAQNVRVLTPKSAMTLREKLWWARCIRANRYRFNYGRHANRTLKDLELPDAPPKWLASVPSAPLLRLAKGIADAVVELQLAPPKRTLLDPVLVSDLFKVEYGHSLELNRMTLDPGGVAFISRQRKNNGVAAHVAAVDGLAPAPPGSLTVALGGSVLATYVQHESFYTAYHVAVLTPHGPMSLREKLWWAQCIEANRYRYNYGRQANRTLKDLGLPATIPPWVHDVDLTFADDMTRQIERDLVALGIDLAGDAP